MANARGYIRPRGGKLEAVIVFPDGSQRTRSTGFDAGQDEQAARFLDALLRNLETPAAPGVAPGGLTFQEWGEQWIAERKRRKVVSVANEEAQLKYHAFPQIGGTPLAALTRAGMLEWVRALPSRRTENTDEPLSSRYVHHVASTVKRLLEEAVDDELIPENPCRWKARRDLPPKRDKTAGKRNSSGFDPAEVWQLLHDERVPEDRRVMYGLDFLTGMRPGEVAARRWKDLDTTSEPLWRLDVWTAINSRSGLEKSTKTNVEKVVPIHPLLEQLLRHWYAEGWKNFMGRDPTPEDLIVPREEGGHRTDGHSNKRFKSDVHRLGLREGRTHYESRSTFKSLGMAGGGDPKYLDLITHPSPREARDLYTRLGLVWPALCRAVAALRLEAPTVQPPPNGEIAVGIAVPSPAADPEGKGPSPQWLRASFRGSQ